MKNFADVYSTLSPEGQKAIDDKMAAVAKNAQEKIKLVLDVRAGPMRFEAVEKDGNLTYTLCYNNDLLANLGEGWLEFMAIMADQATNGRFGDQLIGKLNARSQSQEIPA